jgi:hypothetical protein
MDETQAVSNHGHQDHAGLVSDKRVQEVTRERLLARTEARGL